MRYRTNKALPHAQVWDSIPWFVNGRAGPDECARIEAHLQSCAQCRDELKLQRRIYAGISSDTNIECVPSVSLQRLWSRIDADSCAVDISPEPKPEAPLAAAAKVAASHRTPVLRWPSPRWLIAALAFESLVLAALVLAIGVGIHREAPSGAYRTVSSRAPAATAADIRAVFAPTMTLQTLQAVLQDAQMHLVSGPTEAGVYSLAPLDTHQALSGSESLARLRANPNVRFAESIAPP